MFLRPVFLGILAVVVVNTHSLGALAHQLHFKNRLERSIHLNIRVPSNCSDDTPPPPAGNAVSTSLLRPIASGEVTADRRKMALQSAARIVTNRALFFSLAMQLLPKFMDFLHQPGFLYYYTSSATALSAGPGLMVGSGVFYRTNSSYPNWYRNVAFNETLARFAPRALRTSPSQLYVDDYGGDVSLNYTVPTSPHVERMDIRTTLVQIRRIDRRSKVTSVQVRTDMNVRTPEIMNSVYECGEGVNRWILPVQSPVVDILPRYTPYVFLQRPRQVAMVTAALDVNWLIEDPADSSVRSYNRMLVPMPSCPTQPASPGTLPAHFFEALYPQFRLALRLSHSVSAFLQISEIIASTGVMDAVDWSIYRGNYPPPPPIASSWIKVERHLNDKLLEAEVLANVLADQTIVTSGIFFDVNVITESDGTRTSTAPKAFRATRAEQTIDVEDLSDSNYGLQSLLMRKLRMDWESAGVTPTLDTFDIHARIRSTKTGEGASGICPTDRTCSGLEKFVLDPMQYKAPCLEQGYWTSPHYQCDGDHTGWVVTYAAPFFGPSPNDPSTITFRGIVTVNVTVTEENWRV